MITYWHHHWAQGNAWNTGSTQVRFALVVSVVAAVRVFNTGVWQNITTQQAQPWSSWSPDELSGKLSWWEILWEVEPMESLPEINHGRYCASFLSPSRKFSSRPDPSKVTIRLKFTKLKPEASRQCWIGHMPASGVPTPLGLRPCKT